MTKSPVTNIEQNDILEKKFILSTNLFSRWEKIRRGDLKKRRLFIKRASIFKSRQEVCRILKAAMNVLFCFSKSIEIYFFHGRLPAVSLKKTVRYIIVRPLHTRHFRTQYWDKKMKRHFDKKIFFSSKYCNDISKYLELSQKDI